MPPIPRWSESKTFEGGGGVGNLLVYIRNLTYPKQGRDPSAARSLRSLAVILFMFAPYTSRYHSLRNIHFPWICIFFLLCFTDSFPPKIHPKWCTRSFNFNQKNAKAPSSGRGDTPLPDPTPRSGASRPRLRFLSNIANFAPPPHENIPAYGLASIICMSVFEKKKIIIIIIIISDQLWWIALWFIAEGITTCPENQ